MESEESRAAIATWDEITPEERVQMALGLRVHKETSTFLHEWAHTLGAVHECAGKWIMSDRYNLLASTFSPESARLVRLGLQHRAARSPEEVGAWRHGYRAEIAAMAGLTWDCAVMGKALARAEQLLAARAASPNRSTRRGPAPGVR
jgi:hypothetical protein